MRADSETLTENAASKANWPLALCAGLLGIGQNGLLVMLPQLVTLTGLSLSVWAGLLMFGSMLFLPASPWWGRQSERRGCKAVMLASLSGYLASFAVMAPVVWAMAAGRLDTVWGLAGLILSRLLYGLTVSGLVPAAQTWAIQRAGLEKRMAALATISSGLSCGRLLGPPLAALMLSVSPVAPLWLMAIAPLIALLLVLREVADPPLPPVAHQATRLQASMLPFLLLALLLAALPSCCASAEPGRAGHARGAVSGGPPAAFHPDDVALHRGGVNGRRAWADDRRGFNAVLRGDCYHFTRGGDGHAGLPASAERQADHRERGGRYRHQPHVRLRRQRAAGACGDALLRRAVFDAGRMGNGSAVFSVEHRGTVNRADPF
ncbi:hypothetical protein L1887_46245 [Cichorium endivia]|nr:hypothetical protein L1887_46245 [Cichorium endivia]